MKISKKEKFLLGLLGIIFINVVYYQFVFTPQAEKVSERRAERDEKEKEYNDVMNMINNLQAKKLEVKVLNSNILDKSKGFYPVLLQEKIIIELDTLLQSSGLKGNISFSPIEVAPVEKFIATEAVKGESTLQAIVDEYSGKASGEGNNGQAANNTEEAATESSADTEDTSGETQSQKNTETTKVTTEQFKVAINFTGAYEGLKGFLDLIANGSRDIAVTNIAITPTSASDISGTMNLEFYAVPKIGDGDAEYLKWTLENTYGKDSPFSEGAASGTIEELSENADVRDFAMMLRASSSELPTLTIGKTRDSLRETYLYSDKTKVEDVQIQFVEANGLLYYKYNTSDSFYPKTNTELGKEFTPISKDIVLEISSESRLGSSDNSGVKLKVINNTTKVVNVIIKSDDGTNPRVNVLSEGNTVNVTKK